MMDDRHHQLNTTMQIAELQGRVGNLEAELANLKANFYALVQGFVGK